MVQAASSFTDNPFGLKEGEKFACVGLSVPRLAVELPTVVDSNLCIFGRREEWVPNHWKEWLGSYLDYFQKSNLLIVAHAGSEQPELLDSEHDRLLSEAKVLFLALTLTGVELRDTMTYSEGSFYRGQTELRWVSFGSDFKPLKDHPWTVLHEDRLKTALQTRVGLQSLSGDTDKFGRFRRGRQSVLQALRATTMDERTFCLVRALEALHASKPREGKQVFIDKCTQVTGGTPQYKEFFGDLYATRNNYVHANGSDLLLKAGETLDSVGARIDRQTVDTQLLVLEIYRTILCDPQLLKQFEDDASSRKHWGAKWSSPITVEAIRAARQDDVDRLDEQAWSPNPYAPPKR